MVKIVSIVVKTESLQLAFDSVVKIESLIPVPVVKNEQTSLVALVKIELFFVVMNQTRRYNAPLLVLMLDLMMVLSGHP